MFEKNKIFGFDPLKGRWILLVFGIIINMCLGSVYSWSVFRRPVEEYFEVTSFASGMPYVYFLFFFAFLMPIAGRFIEKLGIKKVIIIGGILVGLGWICSSFATNILFLTITYGVIAGAGVGIAYGAPIALISKWFPEKKGFAVGLVLTGFGLSPFITAPLSGYLIRIFGVMPAFSIMGVIFLLLIIGLALPLKTPTREYFEAMESELKITNQKKLYNFETSEMLRSKDFYFLWICYTIGTLCGLTAIGISSPVAEEVIQISPAFAAILISLFAVFNGVGRPIFGLLTDKYGYKTSSVISYCMILFASFGMLFAGPNRLILYVICFGILWFNLGGWLAIAPTATAALFGTRHYPQNYGFVYTAYGIGALLGTKIVGQLRDIFGSYTNAFWVIVAFAFIGLLISLKYFKKHCV